MYVEERAKIAVLEELAYAKYDAVKDDPNFKKFMFACIKDEVNEIVSFSQDDYPLNYTEAFHYFLFEELSYLDRTVRDFLCQQYSDRYYPPCHSNYPLILSYDPNYDYSENCR